MKVASPIWIFALCVGCYTLPDSVAESPDMPEINGVNGGELSVPNRGFLPSTVDDQSVFSSSSSDRSPMDYSGAGERTNDVHEDESTGGDRGIDSRLTAGTMPIGGHDFPLENRGGQFCDGGCDIVESICADGSGEPNACGECGPVPEERCNGHDDDCDGEYDEGVSNSCGECAAEPEEECNNRDDDCDGRVDEASVCGLFIQTHCRLFIGWSDRNEGPLSPSATWGSCPQMDRVIDGRTRCVGTRGDGRFARLPLDGNVNDDDDIGFALLCAVRNAPVMPPGRNTDRPTQPMQEDPFRNESALASWVQSHCEFYFAYADDHRGADDSMVWGECPRILSLEDGFRRCTSTGRDGQFRNMGFAANVDNESDLAVMWRCLDMRHQAAAQRMSEQVQVVFGWSNEVMAPPDGSASWGPCPAASFGEEQGHYCVSTEGDTRFHRIRLDNNVDDDDYFGISLRAR